MSHHFITAGLDVHDFVFAASKTSKSSTATSLIFFVAILAVGYFLIVRGPRQRARRAKTQQQQIGVGDEVMLTSGIVGRVVGLRDDRAEVEIAPGVEIEVIRAAIGRRLADADGVSEGRSEATEPDPGADDGHDWPHTSDELLHGEHDLHDEYEYEDEDEAHDDGEAHDGDDAHDGHEQVTESGDQDAAAKPGNWPVTAVHPDNPGGAAPGGGPASEGGDSGSAAGGETGKA